MTVGGDWSIERSVGGAAQLHAQGSDFAHRVVRLNQVTHSAVVLSSTQTDDVLDERSVVDLGVDVVRRATGGGMVRLAVGEQLWVDLFLPRGDELWVDDVSHSADWLGRAWIRALDAIGIGDGELTDGAWSRPELGRVVCFAATGPGEATVRGRKLVGISQRRTRAGARFQCTVHRSFSSDSTMSFVRRTIVGDDRYVDLVDALEHGVTSIVDLLPVSPTNSPESGDVMDDLFQALVEHLP